MEVLKFPLSSCHLFEAAAPTRAQCPGDTPLLVALGGGRRWLEQAGLWSSMWESEMHVCAFQISLSPLGRVLHPSQ